MKITSLIYVTLMIHSETEANMEEINNTFCPLCIWNKSVENLTSLQKDLDVKPAYSALFESVNKNCYDGQLSKDATLFV